MAHPPTTKLLRLLTTYYRARAEAGDADAAIDAMLAERHAGTRAKAAALRRYLVKQCQGQTIEYCQAATEAYGIPWRKARLWREWKADGVTRPRERQPRVFRDTSGPVVTTTTDVPYKIGKPKGWVMDE
jgi:hypothetical protein